MTEDLDVDPVTPHTAGQREPHAYGVAFWLVSAVRGTAVLLLATVITLLCIFSVTVIRSDGFSIHAIVGSIAPALLWTLIGLLATFYVTIPASAVITGVIRIAYRHITRTRRASESGED